MMVYLAILTFDGPQLARVRTYLVKISFLEGSRNLKMSILDLKMSEKYSPKLTRQRLTRQRTVYGLKNDLDGASAHTDRGSMKMLCEMFGHTNIIGLRTKVFLKEFKPQSDYTIWSPSSPDLNVCDYWGTV